ncbi:MAG: glycine cleavage system aminomethyltransferase GcvT [bacterium]
MTEATFRRTPLNAWHRQHGARLIEFGGWEMPVWYSGIKDEHLAVRRRAGIFDVSHMGRFRVEGDGVERFLNHLTANDVKALAPGNAQYTLLLNPEGGTIDDLIIYRETAARFLVVVNASNTAKDWAWMSEHRPGGVQMADITDDWSLLAVQGPAATGILQRLTDSTLGPVKSFAFIHATASGIDCLLARTGYTGEDGFEVFVPAEHAETVWNGILQAGQTDGIRPIGLGARDTLRLEACLPLYGHELDDLTSPLEIGFGWVVKFTKDDFIGKAPLMKMKEQGAPRALAALVGEDKAVPRQGFRVVKGQEAVGTVTSGTFSPMSEMPIALFFTRPNSTQVNDRVLVDIRNSFHPARVVKKPFYKRRTPDGT